MEAASGRRPIGVKCDGDTGEGDPETAGKGNARPVDYAGQNVAAQIVGPEWMVDTAAFQPEGRDQAVGRRRLGPSFVADSVIQGGRRRRPRLLTPS